jgi:penicillin V acylase-like amidase (Ntn superfamily)
MNGLKDIRVSGFKTPDLDVDLHWFIVDRTGDCAIIEFPDGQLRVHRRPILPVMTNNFYEPSRRYLATFAGFGGKNDLLSDKGDFSSFKRFALGSYYYKEAMSHGRVGTQEAFSIMKHVTQTNVLHSSTSTSLTRWTIAYDLNRMKAFWFTENSPQIRSVDLTGIDLGKNEKPKSMDVNKGAGDMTEFFK